MSNETQTIEIGKISTEPEHDPYTNIEGVVSKTILKIDPRDRTVWVTQEYNNNSTLADEWNGLILTWWIPGHPLESDMQEWIADNIDIFTAICNGYEVYWNGNNHVGQLDDTARSTVEQLAFVLDQDAGPSNYYETWTVDSWMESSLGDITADMTDEELQAYADGCESDESTIVLGDILQYITDRRDALKWEADTYGEDSI